MSQKRITLSTGKNAVKVDYLRTKKAALILRAVNPKLRQPLDGQWRITGELMQADEHLVVLTIAAHRASQVIQLSREIIAEAKLVVKI